MDSTATHGDVAPASLTTTTSADRCGTCGARLASDQRYCLECGERRGDPRMPFMNGRPPEVLPAPPPAASGPRKPRSAAGTTLVAGVGTLLLAMGVGVLIGRSDDNTQVAKTPPVQVVTVAGAGGGVAAAAPSSATPASTSTPGDTAAGGKDSSAKDAGKADAAKSADKSTSKKKPATPVVKVGSKGKGKGYKDGKFTGDFFGQ
jgi:hypothetical protein